MHFAAAALPLALTLSVACAAGAAVLPPAQQRVRRSLWDDVLAGSTAPALLPGVISTILGQHGELSFPTGVALDRSLDDATLLTTDYGNNRVLRGLNGVVIAGSNDNGDKFGFGTYCGDGGPATSACLAAPYSAAYDAAGNVVICDTGNNRTRRLNVTTGIITTIAGDGLATSKGIAVNPRTGDIVIADTATQTIKVLSAATGSLTIVAGTAGVSGYSGDAAVGDVLVAQPVSVAIEADDSIVFSDNGNSRIRRIDNATGKVSTIVGTGVKGFNGDGEGGFFTRLFRKQGRSPSSKGGHTHTDSLFEVVFNLTPSHLHLSPRVHRVIAFLLS